MLEKKTRWGLGSIFLAVLVIWFAVFTLPDQRLHLIICDVGQGDAILVTWKTNQLLIDGGPNDRVLDCLAKHMPFYDHRLEAVVMTHPQADHLAGLISVVDRYSVLHFVTVNASNSTAEFVKLSQKLREKQIAPQLATAGYQLRFAVNKDSPISFDIVWPTTDYINNHSSPVDLNSLALIGSLSYTNFSALLTADADQAVEPAMLATGLLKPVKVLKVPHHGSKTGMLPEWLAAISPKLCVISVGKNNRYGHPAQEALEMLKTAGCTLMRTDIDGEVEIVSDGQSWWVKK